MNDFNVIDRFMDAFVRYIDSGFGLLGGDVAFLTSALIGIDITLAGLFWALGGENDVIARLIKKILYVGAFAFILNRFAELSEIVFRSFAGLGLTAGGSAIGAADLLRPGRLAAAGFAAAHPLLEQVAELVGPVALFENFLVIVVLLLAWIIVIFAFFILAVQLFVTVVEFKLTSLAGFVLVPFALWGRTAFLAERVLGSVICAGVKVMVLAVIVGIGSGFLPEFEQALAGSEPDLGAAMSLVLASLALLGLGIFGPSIASGLVAGAPQLGAGAAVGTAVAAAGTLAAGSGAGLALARTGGSAALGAVRAGTAIGSASASAWRGGQAAAGSTSTAAGLAGIGAALGSSASQASRRLAGSLGLGGAARQPSDPAADAPPRWAKELRASKLRAGQHRRAAAHAALHAVGEGRGGGSGAHPDIAEKEE